MTWGTTNTVTQHPIDASTTLMLLRVYHLDNLPIERLFIEEELPDPESQDELLGQAMTAIRYLGPENDSRMLWPEEEWRHQKSWLLFIQETRFHVICTKFSAAYLVTFI